MLSLSLFDGTLQRLALYQLGCLWSNALGIRNRNGSQLHAVGKEGSSQAQVINVFEEILVIDIERTVLCIKVLNPDVLENILNFIRMRIQTAVRSDDTVAVEVVVTARIAAVVASISKDFLTGDRTLVAQTLVNKVPDVTTLVLRILADQVPILLETTLRVTHGVSILTLDIWLGTIALAIALAFLVTDVHRTVDICLAVVSATFILCRAGLIARLHPVVSLLEVDAVSALITQTPYDDGRMIDERLHIALVALDVRHDVLRELGKRLLLISHTMRFEICLSGDVDTVFITKVIPARITWIVAGANGVDVQLLHDLDILNHTLQAHYVSTVRIHLVAVGTLHQHRLSVNEQLCVLDFHVAESHFLRNHLSGALLVLQGDICLI